MARIYVSVGSNINPVDNIRSAVAALRQHFPELDISTVYESQAVGFEGENFLNFVVGFNSEQALAELIQLLDDIEDQQQRDRSGPRFSARTIDLDLLVYDDIIAPELNIPRDEISKNAFVLQPLAELAPGLVHPQLQISYAQLWNDFDHESQSLWPIPFEW